ncbi:uncharacterized protein LOC130645023 isoform X2 [Hydractinia symbiolongicarpus]|uniref:uncharacterized protein LOC130645023 isoform X2 n=1 Tax=Hydractinia symbiolongicarpus TaxID=13093 RepID=UPI00254AAE65|nr:uncharacterized protein LOC130645023 isoform X2 [Hydractinia symbiolongicarpus]
MYVFISLFGFIDNPRVSAKPTQTSQNASKVCQKGFQISSPINPNIFSKPLIGRKPLNAPTKSLAPTHSEKPPVSQKPSRKCQATPKIPQKVLTCSTGMPTKPSKMDVPSRVFKKPNPSNEVQANKPNISIKDSKAMFEARKQSDVQLESSKDTSFRKRIPETNKHVKPDGTERKLLKIKEDLKICQEKAYEEGYKRTDSILRPVGKFHPLSKKNEESKESNDPSGSLLPMRNLKDYSMQECSQPLEEKDSAGVNHIGKNLSNSLESDNLKLKLHEAEREIRIKTEILNKIQADFITSQKAIAAKNVELKSLHVQLAKTKRQNHEEQKQLKTELANTQAEFELVKLKLVEVFGKLLG